MDQIAATLIGLVVGIALGALGLWLVVRSRPLPEIGEHPAVVQARHDAAIAAIRSDEAGLRSELQTRLAAVDAVEAGLRERLRDQEAQFTELVERHNAERTAQDARDRAERKAREDRDRSESKVLQALTPVQETLRSMQLKVTELEGQRSRQHGELSQQLRSAAESEERLRATAESLASALRNNATRGVWGETQLRNVVEAAGLTNRVDFNLQSSIKTDAGAGRPDMVVRLPGGKSIAVDAKVPYNSYLEASQIPATASGDDEARRKTLLAQHAKQVKNHIDALSAKTYWAGLEASPEFTVAFIPSESLLAAALEQDAGLLDYAFGKRIALASPVNLWAVLKTVAFTWTQDVLTEDAKRLFDLSKELYSRLGKLAEHAEKLRRSIDSTVSSYNQFASSLESRVLVTARKLDSLDGSSLISTPGHIEQRPKQLTAVELELSALDETGVGRRELEGSGLELAGLDAGSERENDDEVRSA